MYSEVLRILLDAFEGQAGVFLRFAEDEVLVGSYLSPIEQRDVRYKPASRCELWNAVLRDKTALIENKSRWMVCGRLLSRSLVAPIQHEGVPLGLFHICDSAADYDADDLDLLTRVSGMIAPVVCARMERDKLTPREAEVMDLIVSGKTQKQIAADLAISIQTAAKHRAKVLAKLHVHNDVELVHRALQMRRLSTHAGAGITAQTTPPQPAQLGRPSGGPSA
ncbi:MAG: helix-turn-helix transcriptional regulator [Pirellulales bacterium]